MKWQSEVLVFLYMVLFNHTYFFSDKTLLGSERALFWGKISWNAQNQVEADAKGIEDADCKLSNNHLFNLNHLDELVDHFIYVKLQKALLAQITMHMR